MKLLCEIKEDDEKILEHICGVIARKRFDETGEIKSTPRVEAIREALRFYSKHLEKQ